MTTFVEATETFLKQCDHLGDDELPLVTLLRRTAETLDGNTDVPAALANQFRLTYQALADKGTGEKTKKDPLAEVLEGRF